MIDIAGLSVRKKNDRYLARMTRLDKMAAAPAKLCLICRDVEHKLDDGCCCLFRS